MAFRFFRRISILPGVRLNLSKSGVSLSLGPRGASVTLGRRGIWGNVGVPGTGMSYRQRLDRTPRRESTESDNENFQRLLRETESRLAEPSEHEINERYVGLLRDLLRNRERPPVNWQLLAEPSAEPPLGDDDAFDVYARAVARARFARRMIDGDRAAWTEVLADELRNEDLPFRVDFNFGVDDETDEIALQVEIPPLEAVPSRASRPLKNGGVSYRKLPARTVRGLYEDVCCALVLRLVHEVYRTIPDADSVRAQAYRDMVDPATGGPVRAVFLAFATDRESFGQIDLDQVDASSAFLHLGGAAKLSRGLLKPIGHIEPEASESA